jgi:hypothetical protein
MANEITKRTEKNIYEQYGESMGRAEFIGKLMKLNKIGQFVAGQDQDEIPIGTEVIVDLTSTKTGWIKWVENKVAGREMGVLGEYTPPRRPELGDLDEAMWEDDRDPWQFANEVVMFDPDSEELYTYSATSKGGISAVGELLKTWGKHIRLHCDDEPTVFPKVKLEVGSYMHPVKQYGKILYPKFTLVEYVKPPKALLEIGNGSAEALAEIEPPRKIKTAPVKATPVKKGPARKGMRF